MFGKFNVLWSFFRGLIIFLYDLSIFECKFEFLFSNFENNEGVVGRLLNEDEVWLLNGEVGRLL